MDVSLKARIRASCYKRALSAEEIALRVKACREDVQEILLDLFDEGYMIRIKNKWSSKPQENKE